MYYTYWCLCVCRGVCVFIVCGYPRAKVQMHMWAHIEESPLMALHFIYWGRLLQSPEFTDLCSLASQLVLGIPCCFLPSAGITGSPRLLSEFRGSKLQSPHLHSRCIIHGVTSPATETGWISLKWWSPVAPKGQSLILLKNSNTFPSGMYNAVFVLLLLDSLGWLHNMAIVKTAAVSLGHADL